MNKIKTYLDDEIVLLYQDKLKYLQNNINVFKEELLDVPLDKYENLLFMKDVVDDDYKWKVYAIRYKYKNIDFGDYTPKSEKILKEIDCVNGGFSLFLPNTETIMHSGTTPYTYRSHLGLDVTEDSGFICNDNDISIKNGDINFFDAIDKHKAWNKSQKNRIILLVDFLKLNIDKNNITRGSKQNSNIKIYNNN